MNSREQEIMNSESMDVDLVDGTTIRVTTADFPMKRIRPPVESDYHPFEIRPNGRMTEFVPGISCDHVWLVNRDLLGDAVFVEDDDGERLMEMYCGLERCRATKLIAASGRLVEFDDTEGLTLGDGFSR